MKKLLRRSSLCGIFILILVMGHFGGWWDGILLHSSQTQSVAPQVNGPDLSLFTTKLTGWINRRKAWQVRAKRIVQAAGGSIIHFEEVSQGIIFSVEGKRIFFEATRARWEKPSSKLAIEGKLKAQVDDVVFLTTCLTMEYTSQTLICPCRINVNGKNIRMKAGCMNLDLRKQWLVLDRGVEFIQDGDSLRAKGIRYNLDNDHFNLIEPEGVTLNL